MSEIEIPETKLNSDQDLIALIRDGSTRERGFRQLVQLYQERIYWHVRRMVIHHEDANDVVQNTFVKVYRGIEKFKGDAKLYTWIYRIASNEAITHLKKQKRVMTEALEREEHSMVDQLQADPYFDGDQVQRHLQQAIELLPLKQKTVFTMKYYDELTYKDISAILGTSVGALKASFHHAVKKIEKYIMHTEL